MGLISLTLPNDGETIEAADVNTPLNTIATAINGNLDNANIKTAAAIDGSKIASASLTATQMADSVSPVKRWDEGLYDFVASGCVWTGDAYGSTRVASMTAGVAYINGKRVSISAVTSRTFTASKDTYVDVDDTGAISYTEVTNNAASPALAAGSIRIGIIVTGASNIANVGSINQGQTDKVLPIASSTPYTTTDSLGNLICNRNPSPTVIGYRFVSVPKTPGAGPYTYPELIVPVLVPTGMKIRVTGSIFFGETNTATSKSSKTFIVEDTVQLNSDGKYTGTGFNVGTAAATNFTQPVAFAMLSPTAGLHTYGVGAYLGGSNMSISSGWCTVEIV